MCMCVCMCVHVYVSVYVAFVCYVCIQADRHKIEVISWLVFEESQREEAIKQGNALIRAFLGDLPTSTLCPPHAHPHTHTFIHTLTLSSLYLIAIWDSLQYNYITT